MPQAMQQHREQEYREMGSHRIKGERMSELHDTPEEVELPPLNLSKVNGEYSRRSVIEVRERQLKSSLAANREQDAELTLLREEAAENARIIGMSGSREAAKDAEIERLKQHLTTVQHIAIKLQEQRDECEHLRASVGEKWIDVKQELPPANKNHCWLAWITSQNKNGGYIDLVSYGEYICFNEECHEGDANYVEHDDGNMKRAGWYREEETHGGEFDYIFVDLNDKVTHWQPLPAPPTLPGEEK